MPTDLILNVNGSLHTISAAPETPLLFVLRNELKLTGPRLGCGMAQCGSCAVLLDGEEVRTCITPASYAAGKRIVTIEGLATEGKLHPVQQAFLDADALQCGWCTPGMIVGAVGLLRKNANPSEAEIVTGMNGHICRCGTYPRVVAAIRSAAKTGGRA